MVLQIEANTIVSSSRLSGVEYLTETKLGSGAFGTVYQATQVGSQKVFAIKVLPAATTGQSFRAQRETDILTRLNHTNIVKLLDTGAILNIQNFPPQCLIMEAAIYSLEDFYKDPVITTIEYETNSRIGQVFAFQTMNALDYLFSQRVVHNDIKPANILVCRGGKPCCIPGIQGHCGDSLIFKLADFGVAVPIYRTGAWERGGTRAYMSPEARTGYVPLGQVYKVDMWALGKVLRHLLRGYIGRLSPRWDYISGPAGRTITRILDPRPFKRPSASNCLQEVWIRQGGSLSESVLKELYQISLQKQILAEMAWIN